MLVYSCRLITVLRGHHSIKGHKYLILTINGSIHLGDFWKLLKSRCFTNAFSSPPRPSSVACLSCTSCPGDTWSKAFTKCVFGRPNACSTIMDRPWELKKARDCLIMSIALYIISPVMHTFWLVLTDDLLEDRLIDDVIIKTFFNSLYYIKQIDSKSLCVCSVINKRGCQNVVRTSVTHSAMPCVPLFCSYHILTSSVIYYWTDTQQLGIYLLINRHDHYNSQILRIIYIPTNGVTTWSAYKHTHNPHFLQSPYQRA